MKRYFLFSGMLIAMIACNSNNPEETAVPAKVQKGPLIEVPENPVKIVQKDSILLKDVELNEKTVSGKKNVSPLDKTQQKKYSIRKLDNVESDGFRYFIYDTLYSGNGTTVLLISRTWPEENIVWLTIYDPAMNLLDLQQVYYDNSEGSLNVESSIRNNQVKITTDNAYDESANSTKTVTWYINSKNKLVKK
ncbi:hypothetical protein [Ferruginibacter sp. HRS2-29]|uniref:hypothetical protein n=1 Tax=Ferruginibacter sp. HRS2-29 TaxID=2487334 RepID=UPI0020CF1260|nr:hypothetical protein [Ferruginibacter sp. HRS2-29]MCP9749378.1 hypothetical protein [Ferruginibacter sp. HRS2-29]